MLRLTVIGLCLLWIAFGIVEIAQGNPAGLGSDLGLYLTTTRRWLAGGPLYWPYQLAGPYVVLPYGVAQTPILYPPVAMGLFLPFLVLPAFLWWLIPIGVTSWIVVSLRPSLTAWTGIALCLAMVPSIWSLCAGNPTIWIPAFVALSLRYRLAAALVLLKPSLFPFALIGVRSRGWWVLVGLLATVSVTLLPADLDWLRAATNASGERSGLLYSVRDVPLALVPLIAWLGRTRSAGAHPRHG